MTLRIVRRYPVPFFFLVSFSIAWSIWIPLAARKISNPESLVSGGSPANILAVWAPAISAFLILQIVVGRDAVRKLLDPLRCWRVSACLWLFVIFYPALIWCIARGIDVCLGHEIHFSAPIFSYFPSDQSYMVIVAVLFSFPNALGEELGWRGFALPQIQAKKNALISSIILGVFWAIWHLPLWAANGMPGIALFRSTLSILLLSILLTWIYNNSAGSLLLVWIFHSSITITQYFLMKPMSLTDDIVSLLVVVFVVFFYGAKHLSRTHSRTIPDQAVYS